MSRLPLSTELGLVAFVLMFPLWMRDPLENLPITITLLVVQFTACVGSFVARHYERKAHREFIQRLRDKVQKKRDVGKDES